MAWYVNEGEYLGNKYWFEENDRICRLCKNTEETGMQMFQTSQNNKSKNNLEVVMSICM